MLSIVNGKIQRSVRLIPTINGEIQRNVIDCNDCRWQNTKECYRLLILWQNTKECYQLLTIVIDEIQRSVSGCYRPFMTVISGFGGIVNDYHELFVPFFKGFE